MTHSSIATDKQIEYLYSLHNKHNLPIPAEVEGGTISKADASALIESLKGFKPVYVVQPKRQAAEPYQARLCRMLLELEEEMAGARAAAVNAISKIDEAMDRMAPTIKALHSYIDQVKEVKDYEEFLDDNKTELNYDVKADAYDYTIPADEQYGDCPF